MRWRGGVLYRGRGGWLLGSGSGVEAELERGEEMLVWCAAAAVLGSAGLVSTAALLRWLNLGLLPGFSCKV